MSKVYICMKCFENDPEYILKDPSESRGVCQVHWEQLTKITNWQYIEHYMAVVMRGFMAARQKQRVEGIRPGETRII